MIKNGAIIGKVKTKDTNKIFYKILIIMDEEKEITKEIWCCSSIYDLPLLSMVNVTLTINNYTLKARVSDIEPLDSSDL